MTIKSRKFSKGIRLKPTTLSATLEGEIRADSSALRFKAYIDGAERTLVTEDQTQTLTNKTIDANGTGNSISNLETDDFAANTVDTDVTLAADSDTRIATQKATKAYVDSQVASKDEASEIAYTQGANTKVVGANVQAALDASDTEIAQNATDIGTNVTAIGDVGTDLTNHEADTSTHGVVEIVGTTEAQTLSNKSIQTPSRSDVKQDIESNLTTYASTASNGQICFATDTKKMYQVIDSALEPLGGINLDDLGDVSVPSPTDGQGLVYNNANSRWEALDVATQAELNNHADDTSNHGTTGNIVGDSDTQTLTNKTIDSANNTITMPLDDMSDVAAAAPNSGEVLTYNSISGDWESKNPEGGLKNYITNGKAEADTTGWTVYKNTVVGDAPDDFGGTPSGNLTFTRNTTDPLSGLADFKLSTTAANLQGEGVYYEFTCDKVDLATMLTGIIRKDSSDAGIADGDYRYYLASSSDVFVADENIIRVNGEDMNGSDNDNIFQVQTDASDLTYRLCIHRAVTTATATDVYLDELELGPRSVQKGAAMSDTEAYTPSGSFTGDITYYGRHKRIGDEIEISVQLDFTGASIAGGDLTFTAAQLLNGLGIAPDVAKLINTSNSHESLGAGGHLDSGVNQRGGSQLIYREATSDFTLVGASFSNYTSGGTPQTWANGDAIHFKATIPILGWSANTISSEDIGNREVYCEVNNTGGQSLTGGGTERIEFNSIVEDTTSSFDPTTNYRFTAPESGLYTVNASIRYGSVAATEEVNVYINKNGTLTHQKIFFLAGGGSEVTGNLVSTLRLIKGDYIEINSYNPNAYTVSSAINSTRLTINKLASPQTILETETVAARYTSSNNQAITSGVAVKYEELAHDTHNAYNTSTGEYTIPVSGIYTITATTMSDSEVWLDDHSLGFTMLAGVTEIAEMRTKGAASTGQRYAFITTTIELNKGEVISLDAITSITTNMQAASKRNVFTVIRHK